MLPVSQEGTPCGSVQEPEPRRRTEGETSRKKRQEVQKVSRRARSRTEAAQHTNQEEDKGIKLILYKSMMSMTSPMKVNVYLTREVVTHVTRQW